MTSELAKAVMRMVMVRSNLILGITIPLRSGRAAHRSWRRVGKWCFKISYASKQSWPFLNMVYFCEPNNRNIEYSKMKFLGE